MSVTRSAGLPVGLGFVVGGGYTGASDDLDQTVAQAADMLAEGYGMDVTVRFNSDRLSGGAWLVTHEGPDQLGANAEIGLCASLTTEHTEQRRRVAYERWGEQFEPQPLGVRVFAHIAASAIRPGVLAAEERYYHREHASLAEALAVVLDTGTREPA